MKAANRRRKKPKRWKRQQACQSPQAGRAKGEERATGRLTRDYQISGAGHHRKGDQQFGIQSGDIPCASRGYQAAIRSAVEPLFKVKVTGVNTHNRRGKTKRLSGRIGFRQDLKFAIVTLAEGSKIDVTTGL